MEIIGKDNRLRYVLTFEEASLLYRAQIYNERVDEASSFKKERPDMPEFYVAGSYENTLNINKHKFHFVEVL